MSIQWSYEDFPGVGEVITCQEERRVACKATLQEDKQSVCLQLPLFLLLIVCFARTKSPTATIYLAQPFLGRHILRRVFHSGKLGPPQGRLTQETIAFVPARLSPLQCTLFCCKFLTGVFLKGLRLKRISYLWIWKRLWMLSCVKVRM